MEYDVRWIDAHDVTDEQLAVWERNLGLPVGARRWFDWLHRDNPAGAGGLTVVEARAPGQSRRTVGAAGCIARAFQLGDKNLTAAMPGKVAIDPEHREVMEGTLLAALRREAAARFDLTYALLDARTAPTIVDKVCRKIGEPRRFVFPLRHAAIMREKFIEPAATFASWGLDVARIARVGAGAARAAIDYRLEWITDADARFDDLWQEARHEQRQLGVRDGAFTRWRFLACPDGRLDLAGAVRRRDGRLAAYAALSRRGADVTLADVFGWRGAVEPLLRMVALELAWNDGESLSIRLGGAPSLVNSLQDLGFRERPERGALVGELGRTYNGSGPEVYDNDRWYLTGADECA